MITAHIYHAETGQFIGKSLSTATHNPEKLQAFLEANTPPGHKLHLGTGIDHLSQKIDISTGEIVAYQPPSPSADHEWDGASRRWVLPSAALQALQRNHEARNLIEQLEKASLRCLREIALGLPGGGLKRLGEIDAEIVSLRQELSK